MCLFERVNTNYNGIAYKKGVTTFKCGACPECLAEKARRWALRACYEAQDHPCCMVTLTYDQYVHDGQGRVVGERVSDLKVCKRDAQLFLKRLRKYFCSRYGKDYRIKYLLAAEYGKRTHRAHYHAILFNVNFPDVVPLKRSKRGNQIYKSAVLEKIWKNGICTVDTQNVTAACARYCTKYCAKDTRCDDTFMLFSRGIGLEGLLRDFNGKSYVIEGREYPIPRQIWEHQICEWYKGFLPEFSPKYVSPSCGDWDRYYYSKRLRENYFELRDSDPVYQQYIEYWKNKAEAYDRIRPDVETRILQLPDDKYHEYKVAALQALTKWHNSVPVIAPRSSCKSEYYRWLCKWNPTFAVDPCYSTANDTKDPTLFQIRVSYGSLNDWLECPFSVDTIIFENRLYSSIGNPKKFKDYLRILYNFY